MLSMKLENKDVLKEGLIEEFRHDALANLDEAVKSLVITMVGTERHELYERDEIENYVIRRLGFYETFLYGMDDDEFHNYIGEELIRAIRREMK